MGVEPTKDRLAAPPGFEVRTPHRGRLSSNRSNINHYTALAGRTNSGRRVVWPQVGPKLFRSCSCDRLCDRAKYTGCIGVGVCLPCPLDVNPEESCRVIPCPLPPRHGRERQHQATLSNAPRQDHECGSQQSPASPHALESPRYTALETEMVQRSLSTKQLGEELIVDIARYRENPKCRTLYCLVCDLDKRIRNPRGPENDLNKQRATAWPSRRSSSQ
jgi:hypothetical protein